MLNWKPATLARCVPALALLSCAAPKAIVVTTEAPPPDKDKLEETAVVSEPAVPNTSDDGIRLPDMLGLPDEGELRSAASLPPDKAPESGAVIARPPSGKPEKP